MPDKDRGHDHKIKQMPGAHPGVVGHQHIARDKALQWEPFQEMSHCDSHRVDVPGRARDGLGQHASVSVVDTGREVTRFPRHRSKCGAQQGLGLLFDH